MAQSSQLNLPPMPLHSMETASSTDLNPVTWVLSALHRAGLSQKLAAAEMGVDPPQFSRQLAGKEHLSLQRLGRLPVTFWREFVVVAASELGLSINGPDTERQALADVAESMARYLRVVRRG